MKEPLLSNFPIPLAFQDFLIEELICDKFKYNLKIKKFNYLIVCFWAQFEQTNTLNSQNSLRSSDSIVIFLPQY